MPCVNVYFCITPCNVICVKYVLHNLIIKGNKLLAVNPPFSLLYHAHAYKSQKPWLFETHNKRVVYVLTLSNP